MGDFYLSWTGEPVKLFAPGRDAWAVYCGLGRFDPITANAARSKKTDISVNFQIRGAGEAHWAFEFCIAWPSGWQLLFHLDPEREDWPDHPLVHLQMAVPPGEASGTPPFATWRIPLGETQPERVFEYIVRRIT